MFTSRRTQATGVLATGALLLSACGGGNGDDGDIGTINFYSPEGPDMTEPLAEQFEEEVGGNVVVTGGGTNEIVNRMTAEQDNPQGDVWYGGGGWMPFEDAKQNGLIEPYTPDGWDDVDAYDDDVWMREDDWHWVGADIFVLGISYNTEMVDEEDLPQTWEELADDQWADNFQLPNPAASGTATLYVLSQLMEQGEEAGWDYFDTIVENAQTIPDSGAAPTQAVGSGEVALGVSFEFMAYQHQDRGEPVDFHIPEDTPVLVNPVAKIANAPNPEGAEMFIDWLLSTEGQQARADHQYLTTDDDVDHQIPLTIDDALDNAIDLDPEFVTDSYDDVRQEWGNRYGG